jgi:uncharacterized protein with von Willebrand factor type A (vWA) domain
VSETTPATEPLRRFLQVARGAGLRISAAEGIDAARTLDIVGYADREVLKHSLGLVLSKTPDEKMLYDEAFELYFKHEALTGKGTDNAGNEQTAVQSQSLSELLLSGNQAGLASAMEAAGREAGLQNIRFFTQKNLYVRRMLLRMGLKEAEEKVEALRNDGTQATSDQAAQLETRLAGLREKVRDFVERSLLMYARGDNEAFREEVLKSARLSNVDKRDLERMRILVRQMAKKLAARYAKNRRRHLRGHLDARRTIRRNMGWGGVPFITVWKQKKIEKPRIMVLCDVSGSVAAMAQFLLMFLYALNEALSDIRAYAFSGSLIEVSEILEKNPIEKAIEKIMEAIGLGSSNYGNSLADFEEGWIKFVTNKTTIIILGDARGNNTDPRTDILSRLSLRAQRVIWLNPEFKPMWGTGDSDMHRYAPFCNLLTECSTLRHLERAISSILDTAR